jgi:membrane protease YdiL (CAAX protease family)
MFPFSMPWDFALILLVLAILVPWRGAAKMRQLLARPALDTGDRLSLYASTIAFQWVAVAIVIWRSRAHAIDPRLLGIAFPDGALIVAVSTGLSLLLVANQWLGLRRLARLPPARQGFLFQMATKVLPQNMIETLAFFALVGTVALCEEFIYRGFAFSVITRAAHDSLIAGAAISSLLFAVAHVYQGRRGILLTFVVGLLFSAVRIWTASLIPSMAAHMLADLVAGLAAPRIMRAALAAQDESQEQVKTSL